LQIPTCNFKEHIVNTGLSRGSMPASGEQHDQPLAAHTSSRSLLPRVSMGGRLNGGTSSLRNSLTRTVRDAATRAGMNEQSAYSCAAGLMKRSGR
jgi:hypothetical protein